MSFQNHSMSRSPWFIFMAVIMALSVAACDDNDFEGECENLEGTFQATDFDIVSALDPTVVADFDPAAVFRLEFSNDDFTSTFIEPGIDTTTVTGEFDVEDDEVLLLSEEPLLPGAAGETQVFACAQENDNLFLSTDEFLFDFDLDGVFETALFEATFVETDL